MRSTCRIVFLYLFCTLLFQGCATYPPPVEYFPPPPEEQTETITAELISQATTQIEQGRLDLAAATLERGLRIAPKDALLWSQLAEVSLLQHHYHQAQALAEKSNSLAGNDTDILEKNQQIIEEVLNNTKGQQ